MNISEKRPRWPGRRTEAVALLLILLVAAAFRLYRLDDIPPGFTHDEAGHGMDAIAILNGARPIYETVGYGREPLYDYVVAALMPIFGANYLTLRLTSVLAGLALIVVAHFWIRRAFDVPTALLTSALLAVSFWAISTDRQALRSALLPTLFTVSLYFLWRALRPHRRVPSLLLGRAASGESAAGRSATAPSAPLRGSSRAASYRKWLNYGLSGLFLGLSLYTYMAARVLPGVFVLLWFYLLIFQRAEWKQHWIGLIGVVALGVALALPMFAYLSTDPGAEVRLTQLSGPIDRLFAGDPSEVLNNALGALGMVTFQGDNLWLYNIPGRPWLDWITGALFYLGVIIALRRFRRIEYALALFWLLLGVFPSLLTGVVASNLRSIAAQPVVYLFAAVGAIEVVRGLERLEGSRVLRSLPLGALLAAVSLSTAQDYFNGWGQARDVRVAYHAPLFETARYLDREAPPDAVIAISSLYPNRFHDPYSLELLLSRTDLAPRWFTGSFVDMTGAPHASLIFPQRNPAWVITQTVAPIDPLFAEVFARHAARVTTIDLRADDFSPRLEVYRFDPASALAEALASGTALTHSIDLGHTLELLGYRAPALRVKPGEPVAVITYWRIAAAFEREAVLFTHALTGDPNRPILAQQDSLDVPSYYWVRGDAFAQVHRFVIPPDAAPGSYPLEVGAYARADGARLPVYDQGGSVVGDHVIIGSIEIKNPE
ncbi:MAG TPA: glycosyltransferase family 39 protein [Anaerolineae bacterium]|nr:glycosyltransferase family 39 protein [Anaerolineae bacterium]